MRNLQRVLVFPAWGHNPYLNLLSLAPRASGRQFDGAVTRHTLFRESDRLAAGDVLHVHWTAPLVQGEPSESDARAALVEFTKFVARLRSRGVKLVWTVHNQLPHELAYRDVEIDLMRLLARSADVIHVMSPSTADVLRPVCELPAERVQLIPHPSYVGVYGAPVTPEDSRRRLGADPDRPAVLFLGQMRPYKGLDVLLAAMARLAERGDAPTLLLAGSADENARIAIDAALHDSVTVIAHYGFVHDSEVATWFGAADLAVFPYRAILNSGSLHLASAFEVPVVLPGEPHLKAQFADEEWVRYFDTRDPVASLAKTISDSIRTRPDRASFDEFNLRMSPWAVSRQYDRLLGRLTSKSGGAAERVSQPSLRRG
ncbi:glycosyltransferase [Agromyces bauzanensis]